MNMEFEIKLYPAKNVPIHMEKLFSMWKAYMAEIGENGTEDELLEENINIDFHFVFIGIRRIP